MIDLKRADLIQHMLNELESPKKDLTEWEETFIESIRNAWDKYGKLSNKQFDILERIYAEKT